jgi:predicted signal transduction protein with EAL and GGDEF domain
MENNNNIDFKDLWKQQAVSPPNIEELLSRLKYFKRVSLRKLIITNVLLIATSVSIGFIWYTYQPEFISTKIGIILIIFAMALYLLVYNKLAVFYKTIDGKQSNSEYLQKLISIKTKQQFLQSSVLSLYFILLGLGLSLYMYEYASRMTIFWMIIAYGVTLGWVGFNWFYLRPKEIKKDQRRINDLIAKFEVLNKQLEEGL